MKANRECHTEQNKSSKMKYLSGYKYELKREKYIEQLPCEKAREVFKSRSQIMNLKMNYKNMYTNTKCPRCNKEEDNELHMIEECSQINNRPDSAMFEMVQEGRDINKLYIITKFLIDEISTRE